jgi:hypothetical protein
MAAKRRDAAFRKSALATTVALRRPAASTAISPTMSPLPTERTVVEDALGSHGRNRLELLVGRENEERHCGQP